MKSIFPAWWVAGLLLAGLQPNSAAQSPSQDGAIYRVGGGITAPRVTYKIDPEYTEEARKAKVNGTVVMALVVRADGTPTNLRVLRPLGYGLDEKSIEAVRTWTFEPGTKNGEPVNVLATIETNFRLLTDFSGWRIGPLVFRLPAGVSRPVLTDFVEATRPANPGTDKDALTIEFELSDRGTPQSFKILKSRDPDTEQAVVNALRQWRFTPAMQNGNPVAVTGTLQYLRALQL